MIAAYILVLTLTAWLLPTLARRVGERLGARVLRRPVMLPPLPLASVTALAVLTVVGAPPPMLVGMALLLVAEALALTPYFPALARLGVPVLAAGLTATVVPPVAALPLPALLQQSLLAAALLGLLLLGRMVAVQGPFWRWALVLGWVPLALGPSYLALDGGLILAALLGAMWGNRSTEAAGVALLLPLGWGMAAAASHGALLPAAVSFVLVALTLGYAYLRGEGDAYTA